MYKLSKRFTSLHGKLEPDNREVHGYRFGMTQEGADEIGDAKQHLGGATHIFVKINGGPSNSVRFFTRDNIHSFVRSEKPESGWAEYGIEHGSGYRPDRGEIGWWKVEVDGAPSEVVEDIGLPFSEHISTFLVFDWVEDGEQPEPEEPEEPGDDGPEIPGQKILRLEFSLSVEGYATHIRLYTNGTYDMDEVR